MARDSHLHVANGDAGAPRRAAFTVFRAAFAVVRAARSSRPSYSRRTMLLAVGAPGRAFAHRDFRMLFGVNIFEFCGVTLFKLAALQWLYEAPSTSALLAILCAAGALHPAIIYVAIAVVTIAT